MMTLYLYCHLAYIGLNLFAFFVYAYDKSQARHQAWRVSVKHLIHLSYFAAFGCYLGMYLCHHKTQTKLRQWNTWMCLLHLLGSGLIHYLFYTVLI